MSEQFSVKEITQRLIEKFPEGCFCVATQYQEQFQAEAGDTIKVYGHGYLPVGELLMLDSEKRAERFLKLMDAAELLQRPWQEAARLVMELVPNKEVPLDTH